MSRNRFKEFLHHLRFDIKSNRRHPLADDKFAHVSELFHMFRNNCCTKYTPDMSLTVDEQLLPLKSRCSLVTFMPNKPDKYGLKFWIMAEVRTKYVVNILPLLGAQEADLRGGQPLAENVVMRLSQPIKNKGYNICCDNLFTSLPLARLLHVVKTTIVGTIRKNGRELSNPDMTDSTGELYRSKFFWQPESSALFLNYK